MFSWGTNTLRVDGKELEFSAVTYKKRRVVLHRDYEIMCSRAGIEPLSRTSLFSLS